MANKDTEPGNMQSVLYLISKQKVPGGPLLYSGKITKAALVHSGNFVAKSFPLKKVYNNIIHTLLLNEHDQQIEISFADTLPKPQIHLEEQITRPPPFLS